MKKITYNVHSLLSASNRINNHTKAIEELVYNALDAGATSIAIRINIPENTIQVIDNGCGVSSEDYNSIGLNYMTSKFIDVSILKSAPNKYGFRGQGLANIINVSKSVKIVSRHENSEETWMKLFEYGTKKLISICNTRPSRGTTVVITGFLYNLNIQKKSKVSLGDLQSIKTFLEHLSLVHCNISLSLRDDSTNKIVYKIHKNRDIYQSLSTLYNMDKNHLEELQVEKNEYKVTAYLGKSAEIGKHIIFLNGKYIWDTTKLHEIVNSNLSKHLKLKGMQKSNIKHLIAEEESHWIQNKIPDYFIFIKCPYTDYDLNNSLKQSILEFKDWDHITKLLDKLINFFNGNIILQKGIEVAKACSNKGESSHTREQVKTIMEKILGTHLKNPGISHMYNTIKGKQAKRRGNKLNLKPTTDRRNCKENGDDNIKSTTILANRNNSNHCKKTKESLNKNSETNISKSCLGTNISKKYDLQLKKVYKGNKPNILQAKSIDKRISKKTKIDINEDVILRKFARETDSVKKRCDKLERKTRNIMDQMYKDACNMLMNKNIVLKNNIYKRHINISVRKQIDEVRIHSKASQRSQRKLAYGHKACSNLKTKQVQSNYDLLQTILKSPQDNSVQNRNLAKKMKNTIPIMRPPTVARVIDNDNANKLTNMESEAVFTEPTITFKSHNYYTHQNYNPENNSFHCHEGVQTENRYIKKPRTFITKQSQDNFVISNNIFKSKNIKKKKAKTRFPKQFQSHIKRLFEQTSKLYNLKKQIIGNTTESSYTIKVTDSNSYRLPNNENLMTKTPNNSIISIEDRLSHVKNHTAGNNVNISINTEIYHAPNVVNNGYTINDDEIMTFYSTYTIKKTDVLSQNSQNNMNFIFVSKSQDHEQNESTTCVDPLNVCEIILHSNEMVDKEFELSFNETQNNFCNKHIRPANFQRGYVDSLNGCCYSQKNEKESQIKNNQNDQYKIDKVSHHFSSKNIVNETVTSSPNFTIRQNIRKQLIQEKNMSKIINEPNLDSFNLKNRLCFLPKGMSPILQNCQTKNVCEYNLSRDYYKKDMYNNFADDVRNNAEIYKPNIQNTKDISTKSIYKVSTKLTKDSSALKFDGQCLKHATILGQIDRKFIAVTMNKGSNVASTDYLVLFDQHAVHERTRLENNLTDYFVENRWKPVKIDAVSLMLSKDDVLYLHNFKAKFEQLGLQWTVKSVNEVSIEAVPKAILGKTSREVENVVKVVRNLIIEEINIIKVQGGCVSLYPKSIMNLVNSEACRYAIKFGDKLSKHECVELLKMLSCCKTPFQCAHGRPVMAVIMETKLIKIVYKINLDKVMEWKRKL